MNEKEILDYVMNTPGNTNYSVLKSLLDSENGVEITVDNMADGTMPSGDVVLETAQIIVSGKFGKCVNINNFHSKSVKYLESNMFRDSSVKSIVFEGSTEKASSVTGNLSSAFQNAGSLEKIDIDYNETIGASWFAYCEDLKIIVLRHSTVNPLYNTTVFMKSPFASGGTGGTLYVPQALISEYQSASNWSTILGYANNQILPIEGSIYETQYADGTPIIMGRQ